MTGSGATRGSLPPKPRTARDPRTVERIKRAQALRAQGLTYKQIAAEMGIGRSTASQYISDPDLVKQNRLREAYRGECVDCGGPTDGSNGPGKARERCMDCIRWPDEAILDAIRRWAETHGGIPPTMIEWRRAGEDHPQAGVVEKRFGWNNALLSLGFGLKCDRRPETWDRIRARLEAGDSAIDIAHDFGTTLSNVYQRARYQGTSVRAIRGLGPMQPSVAWEQIAARLRDGERVVDVASAIGVSASSIRSRAARRGVSIRELRKAAA